MASNVTLYFVALVLRASMAVGIESCRNLPRVQLSALECNVNNAKTCPSVREYIKILGRALVEKTKLRIRRSRTVSFEALDIWQ